MNGMRAVDDRFKTHKVCVIIPTYNNDRTVRKVIEDVLLYTQNVIIVNDGSTDNTTAILKAYKEQIINVTYSPNKGKGWALRKGFEKALERGYEYAITIDSDGQHFAKDLPFFLDKLEQEGSCVIMGARNMNQENVPGKSSFGNKFSNFWFKFETGISLPDTQTGYRLYPLDPIRTMKFFTKKFEFEIEVLVRLAWKGVRFTSIPITVFYAPKEDRVSHFRPFKDFTRISILNTVLVTVCFFYIWPRNFFNRFYKNKNWKQELKIILFNQRETSLKKANSIAFGVFMGIVPIWGFQLLVGIALAHLLKLNKALFVLAANISIPPMIPLIVFLSYKMGKPWMGERAVDISFNKQLTLEKMWLNIEQYIYGSISLAVVAAALFWVLTYIFLRWVRKEYPVTTKY